MRRAFGAMIAFLMMVGQSGADVVVWNYNDFPVNVAVAYANNQGSFTSAGWKVIPAHYKQTVLPINMINRDVWVYVENRGAGFRTTGQNAFLVHPLYRFMIDQNSSNVPMSVLLPSGGTQAELVRCNFDKIVTGTVNVDYNVGKPAEGPTPIVPEAGAPTPIMPPPSAAPYPAPTPLQAPAPVPAPIPRRAPSSPNTRV
jgi:uncharacterized membrane protein